MSQEKSSELTRELGLSLWKKGVDEDDIEKRRDGIKCLLESYNNGDYESAAWVGLFMYRGILRPSAGNAEDVAINIIHNAACNGNITARVFLNKICVERYSDLVSNRSQDHVSFSGPLVDFDGRTITIKKSGMAFPVDAVLEYINGINIITFSVNLFFLDEDLTDPYSFKNSVIRGIKEWQGDYQVFGGQTLRVVVNVTTDDRIFDNVLVLAVTKKYSHIFNKVAGFIKTRTTEKNIDDLINKKRSMAVTGIKKWSTRSKKIIYITSQGDEFKDYVEIKNVAKHEFGHILGLGDLYASDSDQLNGVEKGTYSELDGYYLSNRNYNLVMSDHHGPISNNDIEMVVLAFSEDKVQLYQKDPRQKESISKALGRGN